MFQTMLRFFDLITQGRAGPAPLLDRCLQILQINPGLDLKRLIAGRLGQDMPSELIESLDVSRLKSQNPLFVRRVFMMCITILGGALVDSFLRPDRVEANRRELEAQLDIIQYGSVQASAETT